MVKLVFIKSEKIDQRKLKFIKFPPLNWTLKAVFVYYLKTETELSFRYCSHYYVDPK